MSKNKKIEIFDNFITFLESLTQKDLIKMEQEAGINWDNPPNPAYYDNEFELILPPLPADELAIAPSFKSKEMEFKFVYKDQNISSYQAIMYAEKKSYITDSNLQICKSAA